jgi:hypothetical protein
MDGALAQLEFLSIIEDMTIIGPMRIHTGEDLHQGGFACPILAADAMDLSPLDIERHVIQGYHAWKSLGDILKMKDNFVVHLTASGLTE